MNPEPDAPELDLEQEVLELLDAFHDGLWSAEQESRLHTLLREDARARNIFIREQLLAAELHHLHQHTPGSGLEPHPEPLDFSPLRPPRDPQPTKAARFPRPWRWGAAAALFLLGLALGWAFRLPTPRALAEETDDGVALLVQSVAPSWIGQRQPNANHILSAGSLRLASGLAQIEFYSGARLILHGPAELELRSAHEAVCHSGRIRVSVPAQARGFKLTTPHGLVRDQGSEFGLETDPLTASRIQVFSGTLEVVPLESAPAPRTPRRLSAGEHFAWNASQTLPSQSLDAEHFASFEAVRGQAEELQKKRYEAWTQWSRELSRDPRIVARYDFETRGHLLRDSGPRALHGSIIGCEFSNGRWADKGALEFKRPGDRVRVHIPGTFEALTLSAWIRVDAPVRRPMGLLLTDGYRPGFPHWQIALDGQLRLGLSVQPPSGPPRSSGYGSPLLFTSRQMGVWSFVATVYDNTRAVARHYFNGIEVASEKTIASQSVQIGDADIGNWGAPLKSDNQPLRSFLGKIDDLTIWNTPLGAEEIREIYEKTRP